jgi:hypothetical protein
MQLEAGQLYVCKLRTNGATVTLRYLGSTYGVITWGVQYGSFTLDYSDCDTPIALKKFN